VPLRHALALEAQHVQHVHLAEEAVEVLRRVDAFGMLGATRLCLMSPTIAIRMPSMRSACVRSRIV
jgi:hypothetical protein